MMLTDFEERNYRGLASVFEECSALLGLSSGRIRTKEDPFYVMKYSETTFHTRAIDLISTSSRIIIECINLYAISISRCPTLLTET